MIVMVKLKWRVTTRREALEAPVAPDVHYGAWSGIVRDAMAAYPDVIAIDLPRELVGKNILSPLLTAAAREKVSIRSKLAKGTLYVWRDPAEATRGMNEAA